MQKQRDYKCCKCNKFSNMFCMRPITQALHSLLEVSSFPPAGFAHVLHYCPTNPLQPELMKFTTCKQLSRGAEHTAILP